MSLSEKLCWEVLKDLHGQSLSSTWLKGHDSAEPPIQNAKPLVAIERDLVLRYKRQQIEDSLYFLEKRGYLIRHGFKGLTRVAFQLSATAVAALEANAFSDEEQVAFRSDLVDVWQPGVWGMKINLKEVYRRFRKKVS